MSISFFFIPFSPGNPPWWLCVPAGILHFSLSPLSSCLSSITLFTYTIPHANCIPQVTASHTPSQFLTHLQFFTPLSHFTSLRIQNLFAFSFFCHSLSVCGPLYFPPSLPTLLYLRSVILEDENLFFLHD